MLYVIPSSAWGAAAAIVSRSFWRAARCSSLRPAKYASTLFGFSMPASPSGALLLVLPHDPDHDLRRGRAPRAPGQDGSQHEGAAEGPDERADDRLPRAERRRHPVLQVADVRL